MSLTDQITSAVHTYLASFEKKDLEGIMSLFADDCWIEDPVGSERQVGRDAVRGFYASAIEMNLTMTLESEIRIAGNEAAFPFRLDAETPDGRLSVRPIDVMTFDDEGRITSMRAYFGPTNQSVG